MHRLIICILSLIAFLVPLAYTPGWFPYAGEDQYLIKLYIAEILVLFACAALIISFIKKGEILVRWAISTPVLFFLLFCFVSVFASADRMTAAEHCFRQCCYVALFLIAAHRASGDADGGGITRWLLCSVILVALFGMWQFARGGEVYATIGNRNFLGSIVILVLPLAVAHCWNALRRRSVGGTVGWVFVAALFSFVLLLTKSRGAIGSLILSAFFFGEIYLFLKGKRLAALICLLVFFILSACAVMSPPAVTELAGDVRLYLWQGALSMIAEHPVAGWGLGTFFIHFPAYRPADYFLLQKAADVTYHPHNEILSVCAACGIAGAAAFLLVIIGCGSLFCIRWKKEGKINPLRGALFVGVIAVFGQSLVDMNLAIPSVAVLWWLSMGIVASGFDAAGCRYCMHNKVIRLGCGGVAVCVLLSAGWLFAYCPAVAQVYFGRGSRERMNHRWEEAILCYRKGLLYSPRACEMLYKLAFAYDQQGMTQSAIDTYSALKATAPYFGRVDFNLAVLYDKNGNLPAARDSLKSWLTLNPHDANARLFLTDIYRRSGDTVAVSRDMQSPLEHPGGMPVSGKDVPLE